MAELFYDSDGEAKVQKASCEKGKHPGEFTKITTGTLAVDEYRCDKCNRPLNKGDIAYYVANLRESLGDPKGERDYFDMNETKTDNF